MKKKLAVALTMVVCTLLIGDVCVAANITNAQYMATIREKNNSYTATNVSVPFTFNTQALINAGYIDADCSNTALTLQDGQTVPFMPAVSGYNDWVLFDDEIGQNKTRAYNLYTGGTVTGGDIVYFPGDGGMTVSDNATLEPGDKFAVEVDGFIDTATSGNIAQKPSALDLYTDSGSIKADLLGAEAAKITQTNAQNVVNVHSSNWKAQTFTTTSAFALTSVDLKLTNNGGVYTLTVGLYATSGGKPTGSALATDTTKSPIGVKSFDLAYELDAETMYAIVLSYSGPDGGRAVNWYYNTSDVYDGGMRLDSADSGANWSGVESKDFYFVLKGKSMVNYVSATATSGEHTVKLSADSTNLYLYIDGVLSDSEALDGVSVPNNDNDWVFGGDSALPYIRSAKLSVNEVLKGSWAWENGTTFTDLSGNDNDATPTFRIISSDLDVSASITTFNPIAPSEYVIETDDSPSNIITNTPTAPDNLYSEMNVNHLPGANLINNMLDSSGIPQSLFWLPILFGTAAALGLLVFYFTRDIMIQSIATGAVLGFYGVMGAIPFWIVIPFIFVAVSVIISRKTVSL